jgi:hypothetical protein
MSVFLARSWSQYRYPIRCFFHDKVRSYYVTTAAQALASVLHVSGARSPVPDPPAESMVRDARPWR